MKKDGITNADVICCSILPKRKVVYRGDFQTRDQTTADAMLAAFSYDTHGKEAAGMLYRRCVPGYLCMCTCTCFKTECVFALLSTLETLAACRRTSS